MNEAYAEWLVKRKTPAYTVLVKGVMIAMCIIAFLLAMTPMLGVFGLLILAAAVAATYFVFRTLEVEFEYLYVSGQFSVDRIYGRQKRKKALECNMEEVQIVAPSDSYLLKDHESANMKQMDFSSHNQGAKTYTMITRSGANTTKILFEPNEKMLHCFKMTVPRKIIQ